jgi:amidase
VASLGSTANVFAQNTNTDSLLLENDGLGLAGLVKSREVSARELAEVAIQGVERLDGKLNAVTTRMFEQALERADLLQPQGPFAGVPFLVKDNLDIGGMITTHGSRVYEDSIARASAPLIKAHELAGLNIIGKANMPEVGALPTTEGQLLGSCHNPWKLGHSAGGSSGGSATAVAAGIVPIAHASDGGGSIRIPASCCGIFGLKPSRRRLVWGSSDQSGYAVDNCVSRSVRDSAMLFALAQDRSLDAPLKPIPLVRGPGLKRLKIGVEIRDYYGELPHADVRQAIEDTATLCEELGHTVVEVKAPVNGDEFVEHFFTLFSARTMELARFAEEKAGKPVPESGLLDRFVYEFGLVGEDLADDAVANAMAYMASLQQNYEQWLSTMDVALTPVTNAPPPNLGYLFDPEQDFDVMSDRVFKYMPYTAVQNALGLPAMSVPLGMSSDNLPIGSHFIAPAGAEDTLLELAYELEAARPWGQKWAPNSLYKAGI